MHIQIHIACICRGPTHICAENELYVEREVNRGLKDLVKAHYWWQIHSEDTSLPKVQEEFFNFFSFFINPSLHIKKIITLRHECGYHIGSTIVLKLDRHFHKRLLSVHIALARELGRSESFGDSPSRLSDSH